MQSNGTKNEKKNEKKEIEFIILDYRFNQNKPSGA